MPRNVRSRLERLESSTAEPYDPRTEEAVFGPLQWRNENGRCRARQVGDDAELTVFGRGGSITYVLVGMDLADLA